MVRGQQPRLGDVVDALDAVEIARRDRQHHGQSARMLLGLEPRADGAQHRVGNGEAGRGTDRDDGVVGNLLGRTGGGYDFRHCVPVA